MRNPIFHALKVHNIGFPLGLFTPHGALFDKLSKYERVFYEGAQGTMLDLDHGTYPYVTSSNTISGGACTGAGVPPTSIAGVMGVMKPYTTRVGNGPFQTEENNEVGEKLRTIGNEFGSTTGRSRRCGWLSIPELKYALGLNGCTSLALTKLDVLTGFDRIGVLAANYEYEFFEGWTEDITQARTVQDLPLKCRDFIIELESMVGMSFDLIGVGPGSEQLIKVRGW